ncbi:hypothetical protein I4I73_17280 [Pseudonocardia sp. KRD-184]|uniref:Uncharacterized protein n=1 Tax=Pseudonocardia oceani TaxID=2792013 RepID=A0ABS6U741_9PSEU|nr:hypothetical protein [Pseudonocardia oceani]MBW0090615.1 hypothetical protein [Pseudonocardia oceani]MBW0097735.1 hypothetical protein [Pseudonocardia oceani]MBW0110328.1 hypothetical protein [Pseudonocardia oceani]MBW0120844.1 hypothetical protein [Pseudonocardia oceani]MBW0128055.1 hypothetical protein [Pseudonocardia oceani]
MKLAMSALCDRATVRDNLLNVLGAGITQVALQNLPGPLDVDLGLLFRAEGPDDFNAEHAVVVDVRGEDDQQVAEVSMTWSWAMLPDTQTDAKSLPSPHLPVSVPLRHLPIAATGRYTIRVKLNDEVMDSLDVVVHQDPSRLVAPTPLATS